MPRKKKDISRELFGKVLEEAYRIWGPGVERAIREAISVQGVGGDGDFDIGAVPHELTAYEIVGVNENDPPELIREVYMAKAKHLHPDKGGSAEKFAELKTAYDTIMSEINKPLKTETVVRGF